MGTQSPKQRPLSRTLLVELDDLRSSSSSDLARLQGRYWPFGLDLPESAVALRVVLSGGKQKSKVAASAEGYVSVAVFRKANVGVPLLIWVFLEE